MKSVGLIKKGSGSMTLKKSTIIPACFVLIIALIACQSSSTPTPMLTEESLISTSPASTPSPKPINTSIVPTETFVVMTPRITATPINEIIKTEDDLERIVRYLYTFWSPCIGYNYAKALPGTPPPLGIEFIEVDVQPDEQKYWVSEIADNVDQSRQAFVACDPAFCQQKIYVTDKETKKVFEINWENWMPSRPIQGVIWIDNDILAFYQSINPERAQIIVIDFAERKYLYNAYIFPDYFCSTPTPTP